ncbi:phosphoribosylglycinamide formyltransferase [Halopseudomonas nanhaiensis]|uniref:phosphoribosylglycinamide formyltransferase n=1 Tax=Halopseudomonas nanhaiensis TaxID=2830842 RepID=UPI001CBD418C|nr:phosphoribosylglycinamide formyltransferase [Halopseudomonas nanhaiensis]UAW97541.1 phosphoribosylglycinamide formyltransferase [Halopseudomonas nanhaiensis]
MSCRVVVLISGSGSNLQALMDQADPELCQIVAVVSNRPGVLGLERARRQGIETAVLDHTGYADRDSFDRALVTLIDGYRPDLVILAGFMRILTPAFVAHYHARLLNIHPSLLPKYKGLNTHRRALEAGDQEHGATVHFVTEELDGGPLILQSAIPIVAGDTPEALAARVQQREHLLYPRVMNWFAAGRLQLHNGRACLDGDPIGPNGLRLENTEFDMREMPDA